MMISDKWAELVNAFAERGVPLYFITDPIDDMGIPSWAVLFAVFLVGFFALIFFVFPVAKATLVVETTVGAKVIVSYGEERLSGVADSGVVEFSLPLGSSATVILDKDGCGTETIEIMLLDNYKLSKQLIC